MRNRDPHQFENLSRVLYSQNATKQIGKWLYTQTHTHAHTHSHTYMCELKYPVCIYIRVHKASLVILPKEVSETRLVHSLKY